MESIISSTTTVNLKHIQDITAPYNMQCFNLIKRGIVARDMISNHLKTLKYSNIISAHKTTSVDAMIQHELT